MKLGVFSALKHSSPKEWAEKHRKLGLSVVNFPLSYQEDTARIEAYATEAKKNQLIIAEVGVWRNTMALDNETRQAAIKYAIGQLELADKIGARCCVNIMGARGVRWDGAY
ncbi:hypothetical protein RyT2_22390 [Pseudolactococcus yaeyamensis]